MSMKEEYEKKMQAQLDEWVAEMEKLKAKAEQAEADARISYNEQIEKLKQHQQEAQEQLDQFRKASEDAWEDMRTGMETAWTAFGEAMKTAASRFK